MLVACHVTGDESFTHSEESDDNKNECLIARSRSNADRSLKSPMRLRALSFTNDGAVWLERIRIRIQDRHLLSGTQLIVDVGINQNSSICKTITRRIIFSYYTLVYSHVVGPAAAVVNSKPPPTRWIYYLLIRPAEICMFTRTWGEKLFAGPPPSYAPHII